MAPARVSSLYACAAIASVFRSCAAARLYGARRNVEQNRVYLRLPGLDDKSRAQFLAQHFGGDGIRRNTFADLDFPFPANRKSSALRLLCCGCGSTV